MDWDVFLSHAGEDKQDIVMPIAERLIDEGLRVWVDVKELRVGDKLRQRIDEGLSNSRFGIVVLSKHFFAKEWPQRELDGLLAIEGNRRVVLPVWHEIDRDYVARFSPMMADRVAVITSRGLDHVVTELLRAMEREPRPRQLASDSELPRGHKSSQSGAAASARLALKAFLRDSQKIDIIEHVRSVTARSLEKLPRDLHLKTGEALSPASVLGRIVNYEAACGELLSTLSTLAWSGEAHSPLVLETFRRIGDQSEYQSGLKVLIDLRLYPALMSMYAVGITALAGRNWRLLRDLLRESIRVNGKFAKKPASVAVHPQVVLDVYLQRELPGYERQHTPLNNRLFSMLRDHLQDALPSDLDYEEAFDWFEYIAALQQIHLSASDQDIERVREHPEAYLWAPVGRYSWKRYSQGVIEASSLQDGHAYPEIVKAMLDNDFFGSGLPSSLHRYQSVKLGFDRLVMLVRRQWHLEP